MIAPLRRRHRIMWVVIGPLLIVLFAMSLIRHDDLNLTDIEPKGKVLKSMGKGELIFSIVEKSEEYVLRIEFLEPIKSAFPIVYQVGNGKRKVLGKVSPESLQEFPIQTQSGFSVEIFDELEKKTLEKVSF